MGRKQTFGRLTEEQKALAESGVRLAYKAAHRAADRLGLDRDEAVAAALYALVRAAALYSPGRGAAFSTFVTVGVTHEVRRLALRRPDRLQAVDPRKLADVAEVVVDGGGEAPGADELLKLAQPWAAAAVRLFVIDGQSMAEAGRVLGVSAATASRWVRDGLRAIRDGLRERGQAADAVGVSRRLARKMAA